jgi:hypothetical protein
MVVLFFSEKGRGYSVGDGVVVSRFIVRIPGGLQYRINHLRLVR